MSPFSSSLSVMVAALVAGDAVAQPTLESLWPNADGLQWTYEYQHDDGFDPIETGVCRLLLDGTDEMAGATVQRLFGELLPPPARHTEAANGLDPLLRPLWFARPALRDRIAKLARSEGSFWPFTLLPTFDGQSTGVGFLKTGQRIGGWRDMIADWSWWFLGDDLAPGSGFTLQLLPDLADDLYLQGRVRTIAGSVPTPAGTFDDAVIVDYLVDYGEFVIVTDDEQEVGTIRSQLGGWVAYVPRVGPVAMEEAFEHDIDCPTCPPDTSLPRDTYARLSLVSATTPSLETSWGSLKGRWGAAP